MTRPKAQDYTGRVKSTRMVTSDVREVVFEVEGGHPVPFLPGMFLNLRVPREDKPRPWLRSYSIVSPPTEGSRLAVLVDTDPQGPGSRYLGALKVGDKVELKAPLGVFHLREASERRVILAANVSAVGVCHGMAAALLAAQPTRRVTLLFQVKRETELFWHRELKALADRHPSFDHVITVAEPSPAWTGPTGTLADHLRPRIGDPADLDVYLAGLGPVVNELREILLAAGVPKERVAIERFSTVKGGSAEGETEAEG